MNITIRQLKSLIAIQETGKISKAANALGLTGPAITLQLKQLEEALGQTLFDRLPDGMRPTAAGLAVLETLINLVAVQYKNHLNTRLKQLETTLDNYNTFSSWGKPGKA